MAGEWTVLFDLEVVRGIQAWKGLNRIELDAVQRVLRAEGPAGLDWNAYDLAGFPDWDAIEEPMTRTFLTAFEERVYRLTLELRPGRTIIVRKAEHFVSRFWR